MELFDLTAPARPGDEVVFDADESRHIARVRRHRAGDRLHAADGRGTGYQVELTALADDAVSGRVLAAVPGTGEPKVRVALAQGILKGDHLAEVVEAATQLGVVEFVPFRSARTVAGFSRGRRERLRKVAVEAMKCSQRTVLPEVADAVSLEELAGRCRGFDRVLVAWESEQDRALDRKLVDGTSSVMLVVGPEGGFEAAEVELLRTAGALSYSLGPRPMRAELAGTVAVATLMYALGEMSPPGALRDRKEV